MFGKIYGLENLINHKIYVGQTTRTLEERFKEHRNKNFPIGKAIRKYGAENFVVMTLEECETPEQLNEREIYWIKKLNCKAPNGYNLTDGGEGSHNLDAEIVKQIVAQNQGRIISEETRKKISETLRLHYKNHPEAKRHLSEIGKGNKNALGHEVSQKAREQISKSKTNPSEEVRKNLLDSHKGKPSPKKGKPGKKASAETRLKMTASQKARWEKRRALQKLS